MQNCKLLGVGIRSWCGIWGRQAELEIILKLSPIDVQFRLLGKDIGSQVELRSDEEDLFVDDVDCVNWLDRVWEVYLWVKDGCGTHSWINHQYGVRAYNVEQSVRTNLVVLIELEARAEGLQLQGGIDTAKRGKQTVQCGLFVTDDEQTIVVDFEIVVYIGGFDVEDQLREGHLVDVDSHHSTLGFKEDHLVM